MRDPKTLPAIFLFSLHFFITACSMPPKGVYHPVRPGQTLYSISRAYNVNEQYLARLNNVEDAVRLRAGQKLFIPGAQRVLDLTVKPVPEPVVAKERSPAPPVVARSSSATSERTRHAPVAAGTGIFVWPLKGDLLQGFGRNGNRNCNGVEIAAPEDSAIHAAADGQVTYSGDGIRGYGNLIIIKHANSYFTIYGFNRKNLVLSGDHVKQGERIALSGAPPFGGSPRLHFEIRQGKSALNPIFYLP